MSRSFAQGRLTGLALAQPSGNWTEAYVEDALGRLASVTSPAGAFGYSYDGAGRWVRGRIHGRQIVHAPLFSHRT